MTWLEDFLEQRDINKYPITQRSRCGVGFAVGKETYSFFVGHPVHYYENRKWKPITLEYINEQFVGSDFSFKNGIIQYEGKPVHKPISVALDGKIYPLSFLRDGLEYKADTPFGTYIIRFHESGVKTEFVLYEDLDDPQGRISFQAQKHNHKLLETRAQILPIPKSHQGVLDPGTNYGGDNGDGYTRGSNAAWATARSTATAFDSSQTFLSIGAFLTGGTYYADRPYLKFDTSGIPDGDTISQVNLEMCMYTDASVTDFDVDIVKADWSASDPVDAGNRDTVFDLGLSEDLDDNIWRNTNGIDTATLYASGNLNTAWVSKTGTTYYMLISSPDRNNTTPTDLSYGYMASNTYATAGLRPNLAVIHAAPAAGMVTKPQTIFIG